MSKRLRVAAAQIAVSGDIPANTRRIVDGIERAADGRAEAVVFPECILTGYPSLDWPKSRSLDQVNRRQWQGALAAVRRAARQNRIHVIVGTIRFEGRRAFNAAYAIDPAGAIAAIYDKVQLVQAKGGDADHFGAGHRFPLFRVGAARCAMQICMDSRYPENYRYLKSLGTQIIFQPFYAAGEGTTWKQPVLEGTLRCRSAENGLFIVAANVAHPHPSLLSRICDRNGRSLAQAVSGTEEIIFADLDFAKPHAHFYEARRADLLNVAASPALLESPSRRSRKR